MLTLFDDIHIVEISGEGRVEVEWLVDIFAVRLGPMMGCRAQTLASVHDCGRSSDEIVAFG